MFAEELPGEELPGEASAASDRPRRRVGAAESEGGAASAAPPLETNQPINRQPGAEASASRPAAHAHRRQPPNFQPPPLLPSVTMVMHRRDAAVKWCFYLKFCD